MKLLRVLQEQEFERVGGTQTIKVDVRVIGATNRDLAKAVAENSFRADLYYRLNVFPIHGPPLRERKEDIPLLVRYFMKKYVSRMGKRIEKISQGTMRQLMAYPWPGNIRELENVIERSVILSKGPTLEIEMEKDLHFLNRPLPPGTKPPVQLSELQIAERDKIVEVLHQTAGNKSEAARRLGIERKTLYRKAHRLGIDLDRLSAK